MALFSGFSGCGPCSSKRQNLGICFIRPAISELSGRQDLGVHGYWLDVRRRYWLAIPEETSRNRNLGASLVVPRFGIRAADEEWRRLRDSYHEENKIWLIECLGYDQLRHFGAILHHLAGPYNWFPASECIAPRALSSTLQHSDQLFCQYDRVGNNIMTELFICVPTTSFDVSS